MSVDLYLEHSSERRKPFGFGYLKAARVDGLARVAQRFLKVLLTPQGSDLSGNVLGTQFSDLVAGNYIDTDYINTMVEISVDAAVAQMRALPSDVGVSDAKVTQIVHGPDGFDVYLSITARSGETAALLIPGAGADLTPRAPTSASNMTQSYADLLQGF